MKNYDCQVAEIATIKPRTFTLHLSDADIKRLYEKTAADGITPATLLESFVGDLLDGTYSHGSDEREFANEYYNRCCYDFSRTGSYLEWLLLNSMIEDLTTALEEFNDAANELDYCWEHSDDPDVTPEYEKEMREMKGEALSELDAIYSMYASSTKAPEPMDVGMAAVWEYLDELERMVQGDD